MKLSKQALSLLASLLLILGAVPSSFAQNQEKNEDDAYVENFMEDQNNGGNENTENTEESENSEDYDENEEGYQNENTNQEYSEENNEQGNLSNANGALDNNGGGGNGTDGALPAANGNVPLNGNIPANGGNANAQFIEDATENPAPNYGNSTNIPANAPVNNSGMNYENPTATNDALDPASPMEPGDAMQTDDPAAVPDPAAAAPEATSAPEAAPAPAPESVPQSEAAPVVDTMPVVKDPMSPNEFAGAPAMFGSKRVMAMGEAPEEYNVETGDTLFDICDQLIDEPNYWPKLWALNPDIKNPHFIYPGMKLSFYPGDKENPPYLQVVAEDDVVPVDKAEISEKELVEESVPDRPREDVSGLLTPLGPRTGDGQMITLDELSGADGVENRITVIGDMVRPDKVIVSVPAFIYNEEKDPLGVVMGGVAGAILADKDEEVIIRDEGGASPGSSYTVLRPTEDVYNTENNSYIGKRYDFVAHIQVFDKAGENLVLGKVIENRLGIQPGDLVFPYRSTTRIVATNGISPPNGGAGNVIVGFDNPVMVLGGQGSLVLFETKDSGAVSVGQTVAVYQKINRSASSFVAGDLPDTSRNIAIVRIIDSTGVGAVGYVLTNKREIRLGDRAGKG